MKNLKNLLVLLVISTFIISCNDDSEAPETGITDDDAAEMVASSLTTDIMSIASDLGTVGYESTIVNGRSINGRESMLFPECGETVTKTFGDSYHGEFVSYNYSASYISTLECLFAVPVSLDTEFSSSSTTESQRLTSSGALEGIVAMDLDQENLGNYLINSSIDRSGQIIEKNGQQRTFSTNTDITVVDLSLSTSFLLSLITGEDPQGYLIAGGSASYTMNGIGVQGNDFSFEASVTFNGDGTALLNINGKEYTIDLSNGAVIG